MSGIVYNRTGLRVSLTESSYTAVVPKTKTLYIKTGPDATDKLKYGLTTDTTASIYSPVIKLGGKNHYIARQQTVNSTRESWYYRDEVVQTSSMTYSVESQVWGVYSYQFFVTNSGSQDSFYYLATTTQLTYVDGDEEKYYPLYSEGLAHDLQLPNNKVNYRYVGDSPGQTINLLQQPEGNWNRNLTGVNSNYIYGNMSITTGVAQPKETYWTYNITQDWIGLGAEAGRNEEVRADYVSKYGSKAAKAFDNSWYYPKLTHKSQYTASGVENRYSTSGSFEIWKNETEGSRLHIWSVPEGFRTEYIRYITYYDNSYSQTKSTYIETAEMYQATRSYYGRLLWDWTEQLLATATTNTVSQNIPGFGMFTKRSAPKNWRTHVTYSYRTTNQGYQQATNINVGDWVIPFKAYYYTKASETYSRISSDTNTLYRYYRSVRANVTTNRVYTTRQSAYVATIDNCNA